MIHWTLVTVAIKLIKPHEKNPRQISKDQIAHLENLIKKFGLIDKPILNHDLSLIGGHQRIKILKKMKIKEVECWVAEEQLSQEDIDHLCIGLNLNQGSWDYDILANQWEALDLLQWGFTEEQLLGLTKSEIIDSDLSQEDEPVALGIEETATTKLGDLYELGPHRLICGDSTMPDVVDRVLNA